MKWDVVGLKSHFPKKEEAVTRLQVKAGLLALHLIDKERVKHLRKDDGQKFQSQIISDQVQRAEYLPDLRNLASYLLSVKKTPKENIIVELCGQSPEDGSVSPFEWVEMSLVHLETESGENLFDLGSHCSTATTLERGYD